MQKIRPLAALLIFAFLLVSLAQAKGPAYDDPKKTDADFAFQGEYVGEVGGEDKTKVGVQLIAHGKGKFLAKVFLGGLPGDGWRKGGEQFEAKGEREGDVVELKNENGRGSVKNGVMTIYNADGEKIGALKKKVRKSPTLGQKPPKGAVVLFDGKSGDGWKGGKVTKDGLLMQGCTSEKTFGSHKLHIEFRLPYQPEDRGQGRANSGVYLQGRYEVQMLDSFGLIGKNNECGGLYEVRDPDVNMCLPPLSWQTYDIEFTAAKFNDDGKLVAKPRITVVHNGVKVHDNVELPGDRGTRAAPNKPGPTPGPVYLQNHGNPVRYRNIWVVEK